MPKTKTDKGAAKRFAVTASGRLRRRRAFLNHILEKKAPSRKRRLARDAGLTPGDAKRVRRLLGI